MQANALSNGTMKSRIVKLMIVDKKGRITSTKGPKRLMFSFLDSYKIGGVLNDIFPLVITSTISHFDMS